MNVSKASTLKILIAAIAAATLLSLHIWISTDTQLWGALWLLAPGLIYIVHVTYFELWVRPHLGDPPLFFSDRQTRAEHFALRGLLLYSVLNEDKRVPVARDLFRKASELTGSPDLRNALDDVQSVLHNTKKLDPAAQDKLIAAISQHQSRPRNPKLGLWIPIKRWILTGALFATWICGAVSWAFQSGAVFTVSDLPTFIALFWLFLSLGHFGYEIWFSHRTAQKLKWFVTLIIRDANASNVLGFYAEELYWRVGKVIVFHIDDEADLDFLSWTSDGTENFLFRRDKLDAAISAISGEVDFSVAVTEDMTLAKQALDRIDLPASHRSVINGQSTAPTGYRWIEQSSLAVDPGVPELFSNMYPVSTRYSRPMAFDGAGWAVNLAVLAAIGFFWVPSGVLASVILIATAVKTLMLYQIAVQRRLRSDPEICRAPKSPARSAKLRPGRLKTRLVWAGVVLTIVALLPIAIHFLSANTTKGAGLPVLLGWVLAIIVPGSVVLLGMRYSKWRIDQDFRVVVFRRNSEKYGYALIAYVMGTLGKYGQVLLLDHETVQSYKTGSRNDHGGNKNHWSYYFAEPDLQIDMSELRPDWQRTCLMELEQADFAVFDWSEEVTAAMAWELDMAVKTLPPDRILIVLNQDVSAKAALAALPDETRKAIRVEILPRGPDDQHIWSNHTGFARRFEDIVSGMMAGLKPVRRPARIMALRGAWPFPLAQGTTSRT